jgi:GAF domain-containing protein
MTVTLESLATCFQGLIPSLFFTCSSDGIPNAAYLSHVEYVDHDHVALSFQFFNKSRRNIAENPNALVFVPDPDTGQGWSLRLQYMRSETEGPVFDRMALRIEAIASYCGLKGIFKLRAADIYRVVNVDPTPESPASDRAPMTHSKLDPIFTVKALQDLSARVQRADSLEALVDSILEGLEESFGFKNSYILIPTDQEGVLVTMATRGYAEGSVGAEVRYGEGIGGMVAEARKPIRISGLLRGMLYALAMHKAAREPHLTRLARQIPVPGLSNPESQLGVPLLVRGELVGVLCLESEVPYRFHEDDKASIELLGGYLAIAIQNMQWQERAGDSGSEPATAQRTSEATAAATPGGVEGSNGHDLEDEHQLVYYGADECILVDGEYLIRGLPAKILWRLLSIREATGREEFTNRELRLDKSLNLPEWKDNLESRLLLLRRRLEQKCPAVRLTPRCRGRFALEVACPVVLNVQS